MGSVLLSSEKLKLQRPHCPKGAASEIKQKKEKDEQPGAFDAIQRRIRHEGYDMVVSGAVVTAVLALYGLSGLHGMWVLLAGKLF